MIIFSLFLYIFNPQLRIYLYWLREGEREIIIWENDMLQWGRGEWDGEMLNLNLSMYPDRKLNLQSFGAWDCWWKRSAQGIMKKVISWGPHGRMGFCGMFYWWYKIQGVPLQVPISVFPWKKPNLIQLGQNKDQCPEVLLHIKAPSSPHPASWACVHAEVPCVLGPVAAYGHMAIESQQESARASTGHWASETQSNNKRREEGLFGDFNFDGVQPLANPSFPRLDWQASTFPK